MSFQNLEVVRKDVLTGGLMEQDLIVVGLVSGSFQFGSDVG